MGAQRWRPADKSQPDTSVLHRLDKLDASLYDQSHRDTCETARLTNWRDSFHRHPLTDHGWDGAWHRLGCR